MRNRVAFLFIASVIFAVWLQSISQKIDAQTPIPTPTPHRFYLPIVAKNPQPSQPIVIMTPQDRQAIGLYYWPDGNIGYAAPDKFYAANGGESWRAIGTFDNPAQHTRRVIIHTEQVFDYMAGGLVYTHPTGAMVLVYHAEQHFDNYTVFRSSLGTAISYDGINFYDSGIVVSAEYPGIVEMAGGPLVVNGDYFYMYFRDRLADGQVINLAVARAPVADVIAGHGNWTKYYNGEFSQPGMGGLSSPLEAGNPLNRWMDIKRINGAYYMILTDGNTMYLMRSVDGLVWGERIKIITSTNELFYPTLIYDGRFLVYYTDSVLGGFSRWTDARLMRLEVMGW